MAKRKLIGKVQIVKELVDEMKMDEHEAGLIYHIVINTMRRGLERGNDVLLRGVGRITFAPTKERKSNMTGVIIPPHKRIKFKPNVFLARKIRVDTREYEIK